MAGLLGKFVDLIIERSKQAPRRANARALLRLRRSLIECHDAYMRCRAFAASYDLPIGSDRIVYPGDKQLPTEEIAKYQGYTNRWWRAIYNLVEDMAEMVELLEIFGPSAAAAIVRYVNDEAEIVAVEEIARRLAVPVSPELGLWIPDHAEDVGDATIDFERALATLDVYIRTTFSADEIRSIM